MMLTRRAALAGAVLAVAPPPRPPPPAARKNQRIGHGPTRTRLDPLLTTVGDEYIYDNLVFNGLTRMAEDLTV